MLKFHFSDQPKNWGCLHQPFSPTTMDVIWKYHSMWCLNESLNCMVQFHSLSYLIVVKRGSSNVVTSYIHPLITFIKLDAVQIYTLQKERGEDFTLLFQITRANFQGWNQLWERKGKQEKVLQDLLNFCRGTLIWGKFSPCKWVSPVLVVL